MATAQIRLQVNSFTKGWFTLTHHSEKSESEVFLLLLKNYLHVNYCSLSYFNGNVQNTFNKSDNNEYGSKNAQTDLAVYL